MKPDIKKSRKKRKLDDVERETSTSTDFNKRQRPSRSSSAPRQNSSNSSVFSANKSPEAPINFQYAPHNEHIAMAKAIERRIKFYNRGSTYRRSSSVPPLRKSSKSQLDTCIDCKVLFIPFDAAIQHYKRTAKNGTMEKELTVDSDGQYYSTTGTLSSKKKLQESIPVEKQGCFGNVTELGSHNSNNPQFIDRKDMTFNYSKIIKEHLSELGRLAYPDIIFLSEQISKQPFPNRFDLALFSGLTYEKIGRTPDIGVRGVNQIAVYALRDCETVKYNYKVKYIKRDINFKKSATEHWLYVNKCRKDNSSIVFTVAGVHLTSQYTSIDSPEDVRPILEQVGNFAASKGIDVLLGDLNLNTLGVSGGNFLNSADVQLVDNKYSRVVKISRSSSNNASSYMGGMIINPKVTALPLGLSFVSTKMLKRTVGDHYYSDHQAIVANYCKFYNESDM